MADGFPWFPNKQSADVLALQCLKILGIQLYNE